MTKFGCPGNLSFKGEWHFQEESFQIYARSMCMNADFGPERRERKSKQVSADCFCSTCQLLTFCCRCVHWFSNKNKILHIHRPFSCMVIKEIAWSSTFVAFQTVNLAKSPSALPEMPSRQLRAVEEKRNSSPKTAPRPACSCTLAIEIWEKKSDFCHVACAVSLLGLFRHLTTGNVSVNIKIVGNSFGTFFDWLIASMLPFPGTEDVHTLSRYLLVSDYLSRASALSCVVHPYSKCRRGWHKHIITSYDRFDIVVDFLGYWNWERMHFNLFPGRSKTRRNFRFTGLMGKHRETSFRNVSISPELLFPISACSDFFSRSPKCRETVDNPSQLAGSKRNFTRLRQGASKSDQVGKSSCENLPPFKAPAEMLRN